MNILGQNPEFHVTPTSGILDILVGIRNQWNQNILFKAIPWEESERMLCNVLRHTMKGYFAHVDKRVCFDKSRGWLEFLELASVLTGGREKVRAICAMSAPRLKNCTVPLQRRVKFRRNKPIIR